MVTVSLFIVLFGVTMFGLGALFIANTGPVRNGYNQPFITHYYPLFAQGWFQGFKVAKFRYQRRRDNTGRFVRRLAL